MATSTSSLAGVRAHFPALERTHRGHPVAYFDGPGGTQVPRSVADAMADYLLHHNANTHWVYPTSVETDALIAEARSAAADYLHASPEEIAFGANMTTLTFHISRALSRAWRRGDEVVVTELDHQANVAPWREVARERGLIVREARMRTEDGTLDLAHLREQLGPRTRLVAVGAASNALGTITDVAAIAREAHAFGALVFVDAVHYAAHKLVDVRALDCDLLACSAYKFYGPHIGILWGRRELLATLHVPKLEPAPNTVPDRLETGTQNHEGMVGATAAINFLASLGDGGSRRERLTSAFDAIGVHKTSLFERLWNGLAAISLVQMFGPQPGAPRTPTVSFRVDGMKSIDVARQLADLGCFVSNGDFYASRCVARLGFPDEGLVRIGCAIYTTDEEIDRLVDGVRSIASR